LINHDFTLDRHDIGIVLIRDISRPKAQTSDFLQPIVGTTVSATVTNCSCTALTSEFVLAVVDTTISGTITNSPKSSLAPATARSPKSPKSSTSLLSDAKSPKSPKSVVSYKSDATPGATTAGTRAAAFPRLKLTDFFGIAFVSGALVSPSAAFRWDFCRTHMKKRIRTTNSARSGLHSEEV